MRRFGGVAAWREKEDDVFKEVENLEEGVDKHAEPREKYNVVKAADGK